MPGAQSRDARGDAGFRIIASRSVLTATARFYAKDAGAGTSPLVAATSLPQLGESAMDHDPWHMSGQRDVGPRTMARDATTTSQSVREYTLGTTATFNASESWTHALTVGVDGYRLGQRATRRRRSLGNDSALRAAAAAPTEPPFARSTVGRFGSAEGAAATTTFAAEYSALQQRTATTVRSVRHHAGEYAGWQSNTGIVGQVDASWRGALYATSGLRLERNDGLAATSGLVSLPMLGGAAVHEFGPVTTKLRASYGKGIRPAGTELRASWLVRQSVAQKSLAPEEQSGLEAGIDAFVGRFALHLTRFDQYAYNLIQPVAIASTLTPNPIDESTSRLMYALQNVGEITNRGWELESALSAGALSLSGTVSLVDSRVRRLADGYTGDLQPGDRMLAVPAWSGGLTSTWTARRWSASLTATRAASWLNMMARASAASVAASHPIVGAQLRDYWRPYQGSPESTHPRLAALSPVHRRSPASTA
jgi:iron complex outermembrane receptor protein